MKRSLRLQVLGVRLLFVGEQSKVKRFPLYLKLRFPFASVRLPTNAKQPGLVPRADVPLVLSVDLPGYVAQIRNAVIRWVAVDVIELGRGPIAISHQPRDSMRLVPPTVNKQRDVSLGGVREPSRVPHLHGPRKTHLASEYASSSVVVEKLFGSFTSEVFHAQF